MGEVLPMPAVGDVFTDVRGGGRTMRVSQHADQGVVVVSFWAGDLCRSSFRLSVSDAARLAALLGDLPASPADDPPAVPGGVPSALGGGIPSVPAGRAADEDAA
jgi:hypothetical protein